jgi:hypothetical protein
MRTQQYLTNCDYSHSERNADYKMANLAESLFEYSEGWDGGRGNLCSHIIFNSKTKKAKFVKEYWPRKESETSFCQAIPSALLMYRLSCLFPGQIKTFGREAYKFVWQFNLKHRATGEMVCFGEWKGGALFWTNFDYSNCPPLFKNDLEKLLTILVSDNCPHPYDGLVAGGVA